MRGFVAILPPAPVTEELARVQATIPAGRRVDSAGLHLTLAFLGEQPHARLEALHEGLTALRAEPVRLVVAGIDLFPQERPRIVAARVAPTPALTALRKAVRGACRAAGIELERTRFRPHITLARLPRVLERAEAGRLGAWLQSGATAGPLEWQADAFSLMHSRLDRAGAIYDELARYRLGDDPPRA